MKQCWCGNKGLQEFMPGKQYNLCLNCGTLISFLEEKQILKDDKTDFYGEKYWNEYMVKRGLPPIETRMRADLPERDFYWLKHALKYKLPTGLSVDVGCAHGGHVALMKHAGYQAMGVDLSKYVIDLGRNTFNVDLYCGIIDDIGITEKSVSVITLMDVIEHVGDPVAFLANCRRYLADDGIMIIQTPRYEPTLPARAYPVRYPALISHMNADDHLWLFSNNSLSKLAKQVGMGFGQFETAIFGFYDQMLICSPSPLKVNSPDDIWNSLKTRPESRIIQAMIDLEKMYKK